MSLYLILEIVIILFPLILSFDKKMRFYKRWKSVLLSLLIVGGIFIIWDIYFTRSGIWGFNAEYHSGIVILDLPLEEWLFFIVVPYASIFIHFSMEFVHPKIILPQNITKAISLVLITGSILIALLNTHRTYTFIVFVVSAVTISYANGNIHKILNRYYISFLIIMIPLLVFNGIWTGTFIKDEVFWYKESSITGIRIFSIPVEDFAFAFSLILLVIQCIYKSESLMRQVATDISDEEEEE
jgi:lycopene cyclase domain-containing protein